MGINVTHINLNNFSFSTHGSVNFPYPCEDTTICTPYNIILDPGFYLLEVWGAEGGDNGDKISGPGGYSFGTLRLIETTKAYVYVGGKGKMVSQDIQKIDGGYNGGGCSEYASDSTFSSGGGASDIRINEDSHLNRIIVAGGGGGLGIYNRDGYYVNYGGFGGGENGGDGEDNKENENYGKGGSSQITINNCTAPFCYSGGGGGWENGEWGIRFGSSGGGGSGFVYNLQTKSYVPEDYKLNSFYLLRNAKTLTSQTGFLSPDSSYEFGHRDNGYARITILNPFISCVIKNYYKISYFLYVIFINYPK